MSQYTPEQVEAIAAKLADSVSIDNGKATGPVAAPMLYAYAATLRQQAARVDDVAIRKVVATLRESAHDWDNHDELADNLEAALSAQPAPERQGECEPVADVVTHGNLQYGKLRRDVPDGTKLYTHPAAPVGVPDVRVDKQGVRFGDGCWYSHERITGVSADLLNEGKCSITAREYMKWVQKRLAAAPSAPQGTQQGEG